MRPMRPCFILIVGAAVSMGAGCAQSSSAHIRLGDPGEIYRLYQIELRMQPHGSSTCYAAGDNRHDVLGFMPRYHGLGQMWYAAVTRCSERAATAKFVFVIQNSVSPEDGHAVFVQYSVEAAVVKMTQEGYLTGAGTAKGQEFVWHEESDKLMPRDVSLPETRVSFAFGPVESFLPLCPAPAALELISYRAIRDSDN